MEFGTLGKYVSVYRPARLSLNRAVNRLVAPPRAAFLPSAVVVQQKIIPDVSFYQGEIDFERMRQQTDALIMRAGQSTWVDTQFKRNWALAKKHGMQRSSYWFYDDRTSPGRQAEIWVSLLQDDLPEMEIWCDWETSYGGPHGGLANVVAFMQAVERALPVEVGMYTGYYWFRDRSNAVANASQYAYLKKRKLFQAWYTANAADVRIPQPWASLFLWQFGTPAIGSQYGVATAEIDLSYINMTDQEFQARYTGAVVPVPTGDSMAKYEAINSGDGMALRPDHHTDNAAIERFPAGTKWHGDTLFVATEPKYSGSILIQAVGDQWLEVTDVNGNTGKRGWLAIIHKGVRYCSLTETNPSPASTILDMPIMMILGDDVTYEKQTITTTMKAIQPK